jgi:DNA topoisomerase-1
MARPKLVYVSDQMPGIRRRRRGRGFEYRLSGRKVPSGERERIAALAIPPAWTDVWICPDPNGHLQATGRDAKGRKQYRYHPQWRAERDQDKYDRLLVFGRCLPDLRSSVEATLVPDADMTRDVVLALVIHLLDETLIRIGNVEYAETNGSFGITTLGEEHLVIGARKVRFNFVGKSGTEHDVEVDDPRVARLVRRCHHLGGQHLFSYLTDDADVSMVTSTDVNERLRELTGEEVTAKDFRTWGGTSIVTEALATSELSDVDADILAAIDTAAEKLHNTRAVCRTSYVHPAVVEAAREGRLHDNWRDSRSQRYLRRGEVTLLKVLEEAAG